MPATDLLHKSDLRPGCHVRRRCSNGAGRRPRPTKDVRTPVGNARRRVPTSFGLTYATGLMKKNRLTISAVSLSEQPSMLCIGCADGRSIVIHHLNEVRHLGGKLIRWCLEGQHRRVDWDPNARYVNAVIAASTPHRQTTYPALCVADVLQVQGAFATVRTHNGTYGRMGSLHLDQLCRRMQPLLEFPCHGNISTSG